MNKIVKNVLLWGGAFAAYRFYKLYEMGNSIIYKPVGIKFKRGATLNDLVIQIKMELLNPTKTSVSMRGIDGELITKGQTIGFFNTGAFQINAGISHFNMDFKVDFFTIGAELIQAIISKKVPSLNVKMKIKIPFFTIPQNFTINPNSLPIQA
jgi:hypothetical protein